MIEIKITFSNDEYICTSTVRTKNDLMFDMSLYNRPWYLKRILIRKKDLKYKWVNEFYNEYKKCYYEEDYYVDYIRLSYKKEVIE